MATFTGQLNPNELFASLYNMIISQQMFVDNIEGEDLVDKARVDGGLYGDTKLYYSTDALSSSEWDNDAEASTLLQLYRPKAPQVQAIKLDKFRQIRLTVDEYLSKRAWMDEGSFTSFNSSMLGWITDTKKAYDATTYNCYVGTTTGASKTNLIEVPLSNITATGVEKNKLEGEMIAEYLADLVSDLSDYTRDFNDYGQFRRFSKSRIKFIFNEKFVNKIRKLSLPEIFNNEGIDLVGNSINARYFGEVNAGATAGDGSTVRSLVEQVIGTNHYFAGDLIKTTDTAPAGTSYTQDKDVICKVYVELPPYMSAFEVGTSFFNPKSLTETHYLTWGHNSLEYLKNYPLITVHAD